MNGNPKLFTFIIEAGPDISVVCPHCEPGGLTAMNTTVFYPGDNTDLNIGYSYTLFSSLFGCNLERNL